MIGRRIQETLIARLGQFPVVALLGPRQVGKTTLSRRLLSGIEAEYLDLENPLDLEKLSDPHFYLSRHSDKLVIIDEVQRVPGLFQVLRGIVDERILSGKRAGHFLLLGSVSIDLLKQSSETLAGRIAYLELAPLDILEASESVSLEELWRRGGFPRSVLANSEQESVIWRSNFITTYLERDIPLLGPRIPAETLRRFWTMLAHSQGGIMNASDFARSLSVDSKTIANYLDLMVDLLLVRRLPPLFTNTKKRLVKSPKVYVRDSGLVHSLLLLDTAEQIYSHPVVGRSWQGFVIENLINTAPERTKASFFRTSDGKEIDLILDLPGGQRWAIEIKKGSLPKLEGGFMQSIEMIEPQKSFVIYHGQDRYMKNEKVEAIGLLELTQELALL